MDNVATLIDETEKEELLQTINRLNGKLGLVSLKTNIPINDLKKIINSDSQIQKAVKDKIDTFEAAISDVIDINVKMAAIRNESWALDIERKKESNDDIEILNEFPFDEDENFLPLSEEEQNFVKLVFEKEYLPSSKKGSVRNGDLYRKAFNEPGIKNNLANAKASSLLVKEDIALLIQKIKFFVENEVDLERHELILNLREISNSSKSDSDKIRAVTEIGKLLDKYPASKSKTEHSGSILDGGRLKGIKVEYV